MTPTLERARRYIAWSYLGLAALCCFPLVSWGVQMHTWEPYALAACVALLAGQAHRWDREAFGVLPAISCAVTVAAWITAVATDAHPIWAWPATFAVAMAVREFGSRYRERVAVAFGVMTLATASGLVGGLPEEPAVFVLFTAVSITIMVTSTLFTDWTWRLFGELDDARQAAGELAVTEERLRFAADLHDIQGHTLQTIALKSELARRTVERDPARAVTEIAAIEDLARRALEETREVVHGYRNIALGDELANAEQVLTAAGIRVERDDASALEGAHSEVLGLVVREATTNIIRHSHARTVTFEAAPDGLTIRNDGVLATTEGPHDHGTGLAGLRARLATTGGSLTSSSGAGVFELIARIDEGAR